MALSLITDIQKNNTFHDAWIALGGNVGDVQTCFQSARQSINKHLNCKVIQSSRLYQTPPLGPKGQSDYLNAVISITTTLTPESLLCLLQDIETIYGRIRREHWGERTLDLDILAYDDINMSTSTLILPHNQLHLRQFVLKPLCDIAPNWHHPDMHQSAKQLLESCLKSSEPVLTQGKVW